MSETKQKDKLGTLLIILCCAVYFSSYVMRYSYSVSKVNIMSVTGLSKSSAGLISTALFLSYGTGQIVSGFLGDKLKPHLIILAGIIVGSLSNFIFPLCNSVVYYVAVWTVNGFAQAMLWPPLVKIMSDKLSTQKCSTAIVLVSACANAATVILYFVVPVIFTYLDWTKVFLFAGIFSAAIAALWGLGYAFVAKNRKFDAQTGEHTDAEVVTDEQTEIKEKTNKNVKIVSLISGSGLITVMLAIIAQGFLRDGITDWFPNFTKETFNIPEAKSVFLTSALSIMAIVSIYATKWIFRRFMSNEVKLSIVFFAVVIVLGIILFAFFNTSIILSVGASALMVALAHGINLLLIAYIPPRFAKTGRASTVSGVLNACTYIGSGLSTYVFALIAENIGWRFVVLCWIIISVAGCVACIFSLKKWNKYLASTALDEQ